MMKLAHDGLVYSHSRKPHKLEAFIRKAEGDPHFSFIQLPLDIDDEKANEIIAHFKEKGSQIRHCSSSIASSLAACGYFRSLNPIRYFPTAFFLWLKWKTSPEEQSFGSYPAISYHQIMELSAVLALVSSTIGIPIMLIDGQLLPAFYNLGVWSYLAYRSTY